MRSIIIISIIAAALVFSGCEGQTPFSEPKVVAIELREIQADRLSYRYEADVPAPPIEKMGAIQQFNRDENVQSDFDENRPLEMLDRTIASPDNSRIVAVYRKPEDLVSDFRLDIYTKEGKLLKKVTHEEMAAQFPDTIVWAPDGTGVAFVAKVRGKAKDETQTAEGDNKEPEKKKEAEKSEVVQLDGEETEEKGEEKPSTEEEKPAESDSTKADDSVLTFRTEQLYLTDANGSEVRPITRVEGLMYFYFVWAPDSSALAALAAIHTEWTFFEARARDANQVFVPRGRPRLIEKNGRERRLDDMLTAVHPVWSPDSSKVAIAFDKQVRVYDGVKNRPTQAMIPLEGDLRRSAQEYDKTSSVPTGETGEESNTESDSTPTPTPSPSTTVPDANQLDSFNPIVNLVWADDKMLYLETGLVRNYTDETEAIRSYMRWHRLVLSAQPIPLSSQAK